MQNGRRPTPEQVAKAKTRAREQARARAAAKAREKRRNRRLLIFGIVILAVLLIIWRCNKDTDGAEKDKIFNDITTVAPVTTIDYDNVPVVGNITVKRAAYTSSTVDFPAELPATNGILIDLNNNTVIAAKGGEERVYPASITKLMTLIVAMENCTDLDDTFKMTSALIDPVYVENASMAGFSAGEVVTVRDMLYGLALPSGGDAAMGLATYVAGSEEAFVEMMNKKAADMGLTNTHFENCVGLHDKNHYSTCHELAMILEYAISNDAMREIISTYQYTTSSTEQHPEGILLSSTLLSRVRGDEPNGAFILGGKTGYTVEAKHCLASFAVKCEEGQDEDMLKRADPDYILVTVGSDTRWGPIDCAVDLYGDPEPADE